MSPEELEALLTEMEPDIRAADRDMQEIEALEKRGVLSAANMTGKHFIIKYLIKLIMK